MLLPATQSPTSGAKTDFLHSWFCKNGLFALLMLSEILTWN